MGACQSGANKITKVIETVQNQKPLMDKAAQIQSQLKKLVAQEEKITDKAPEQIKQQAKSAANMVKKTVGMTGPIIGELQKLLNKPPSEDKSEANKTEEKIGDQSACLPGQVEKVESSSMAASAKVSGIHAQVQKVAQGVSNFSFKAPEPLKKSLQGIANFTQVQKVADEVSKFSSKAPTQVQKPLQGIANFLQNTTNEIPFEKIGNEVTKLVDKLPTEVKDPISNKPPLDQITSSEAEIKQSKTSGIEKMVQAYKTLVVQQGNGVEETSNTKISKIQTQVHQVSQEVAQCSERVPEPVKAPIQKESTFVEEVDKIPMQKIGDELSILIENKAPPKVEDKVIEAATKVGVNLQEEPITEDLFKDEKFSFEGELKKLNGEVEEKGNIIEAVVELGNILHEASNTKIGKIETQIHEASQEVSKFSNKAPERLQANVQKDVGVLERSRTFPL